MADKSRRPMASTRANSSFSPLAAPSSSKPLPAEIEACLDRLRAHPQNATDALRKYKLIPEDSTPNVGALTTGLLHLAASSKLGATALESICAFAIYAESIQTNVLAEAVTQKIEPAIEVIAGIAEHRDDQQERLADLIGTQEQLNTTVDGTVGRLATEVQGLVEGQRRLAKELEGVRRLQNDLTDLTARLTTAAEKAEVNARQLPATSQQQDGALRPSYAAMVTHILPTSHTMTITRQDAQFRKVLIDRPKGPNGEDAPPLQLTDQELVKKASLALELMRETGHSPPEGARFLTVKRLRHGGLLYELNTKEAASWLQQPENMRPFTANYGMEAFIRAKHYPCLVRNAPAYLQPTNPNELREMETENEWNRNEILAAHWIKPIDKRRPGQQRAHLIVKFSTPQRANEAIMKGMAIHNTRLPVEKLRKEARRCLRCQKLEAGHLARDCEWIIDICGTCGGDHTTQDCTSTCQRCVNCSSDGHASWSRTCPAFIEATRKIQEANKLEQYRFYPLMDDPSTWDHLDSPNHLPRIPPTGAPPVPAPEPLRHSDAWADEMDETWQQAPRPRHRARSPLKAQSPPPRGANAIPIDPTRPRTWSMNGPAGQRQTTLTREGGFNAGPSRPRNLSDSRPSNARHE